MVIKKAALGEGLQSGSLRARGGGDNVFENVLDASWITDDPAHKVPKELAIEQPKEGGPYSIFS